MDWKGEFIDSNNSKHQSSPTDDEFKELYEDQINQYLNSNETYNSDENYVTNIPVLDNNFVPLEVTDHITKLKVDKTSGPDGTPQGSINS